MLHYASLRPNVLGCTCAHHHESSKVPSGHYASPAAAAHLTPAGAAVLSVRLPEEAAVQAAPLPGLTGDML